MTEVAAGLSEIRGQLKANSTKEAKEAINNAVPGFDGIYSVRMPVINRIAKDFRDGGFPLIIALWDSGSYAERMLAAKILSFNCRKDPELSVDFLKRFSVDIDNWAVCDTLCSEGIRPIIKGNGELVMDLAKSFLNSGTMWIRRMGIVLLIHFAKMPEKKEEVRKLIQPLRSDKEHYIKKAIEWIARYLNKH